MSEIEQLTDDELNEAMKAVTGGDIEVHFVDKNDTFSFKCRRCGKCCMGGRSDIILTAFDIYRIAQHLNISCDDVIKDYCLITIGRNSKLPVIILDYNDHNGWCKFLSFDIKNGGVFGCSINDVKPGVCENHPIGIVRSFKENQQEIRYMITEMCNNHLEEEHLVADWVAGYESRKLESEAASKLSIYPVTIIEPIKLFEYLNDPERTKGMLSPEGIQGLIDGYVSLIVGTLYGNYDTSIPFLDQIEGNKLIVKDALEKIRDLFNTFGIDISPEVDEKDFSIKKKQEENIDEQ